ncbi:hypothetical protein [Pseudomonas sp. LP_7_YM]|uniref:hypothetical protein n=1 Tax=Pseudomonas sp. LP_7_YM TaxID=2485137 RepID=UPI001061F7CE|nr:hypothetical protein [Pseudomonas sp. LP_7_YM]
MMSDQKLDEIRGAAKILGQPLPSVTLGLKTYHVTWKQFGAMDDYRSYIRHGFSYNPGVRNTVVENEVVHDVAGDVWFADRISNPNTWNSAYSVRIDSHLQALDKTTGQPMNFGWRTTSWNRPISTFRW